MITTIPVMIAALRPLFSRLSFSIFCCSNSFASISSITTNSSVFDSSSFSLYFPRRGAIIFSIIIVPTIDKMIERTFDRAQDKNVFNIFF